MFPSRLPGQTRPGDDLAWAPDFSPSQQNCAAGFLKSACLASSSWFIRGEGREQEVKAFLLKRCGQKRKAFEELLSSPLGLICLLVQAPNIQAQSTANISTAREPFKGNVIALGTD